MNLLFIIGCVLAMVPWGMSGYVFGGAIGLIGLGIQIFGLGILIALMIYLELVYK